MQKFIFFSLVIALAFGFTPSRRAQNQPYDLLFKTPALSMAAATRRTAVTSQPALIRSLPLAHQSKDQPHE